jgi:hypothetical protein
MSEDMPKFDNSVDSLSEEDFAEVESEAKTSKVFKPGQHDVTIAEADWKKSKSDDRWILVNLKLEGTAGKQVYTNVHVPLANVTKFRSQAGTESTFVFRKFKTFCAGLGFPLTAANVKEVVTGNFFPVSKLVGRPLKVVVGYEKGHVEWHGKDEKGVNQYKLVLADGNTLVGPTNQPVLFADRAAAINYAKEKKIAVDAFPTVLDILEGTPVVADASW